MILALIFIALALMGLLWLVVSLLPTWVFTFWHGIVLAVACAALLLPFILEMLALRQLKIGILKAREGLLDEISLQWVGWTLVGRTVQEYNQTIGTLRTMFRSVEECQGRFLNQRNKMNTLLQNLPGAMISLSEDLYVSLANKEAVELFGGDDNDLIGANLFDFLHLQEHDRELLRDAFLYKQPVRNQEISLTSATGMRYYSLNLDFYSDEDADMGGVLILQDISDYRQLQNTVALREKLVAMGQLAAGVAHELNTPLGSILGYAQLIDKELEAQEQSGSGQSRRDHVQDYAKVIGEEAKRCSRIVRDLLNYARDERCSGETCEVTQMIRELIETFLNCQMKRYKIAIQLDLPSQLLVVEGDCGQLDIVLTNLIINAIHALDGVENPVITIAATVEDAYALISVADNGPGVPEEIRSRIFDPFFTTKEVGQGSGLGLPISHAILAKRGGAIVYDAEYTGGARFLIKLPAVDLRRAGM